MPFPSAPARWVLLVSVAALPAGCAPEPEVRSYVIEPATTPVEIRPVTEKVRLLGAIVPVPGKSGTSWFVKLVGDIADVTPVEKDFSAFIASLRVTEAEPTLAWTVPPGWTALPGNENRLVTLLGGRDGRLQMYISRPFEGSLAGNVNRWRTLDAGLRKLPEAEAGAAAVKTAVGSMTVYRVDLKGPGGLKKGPAMGG